MRLQDGSITLNEVDFIQKRFQNDEEQLREDLCSMSPTKDTQWVDVRLTQFTQYQVMSRYKDAATVMLNLRDIYLLGGDFSPLEDILLAVSMILRLHLLIIN